MNKKSFFSVLLVLVAFTLVLSVVAGCSRPKPEAKTTPTVILEETSDTPEPAPTQIVAEPTVVTTKPTQAVPAPTSTVGAGGENPTPISTQVAITPIPSTPAPAETSEEWFLYTVRWGDTLYSLAARYSVTVEAITALNDIGQPDELQAGMQIKIPTAGSGAVPQPEAPAEYVVQAGDDLNAIANKFGVTVDAIVKANGLTNPDFIYVGQKLVISSGGEAPAVPSGGTVHVVKPGETIDIIAAKYNTTRAAIVAANNLVNANWIYVGQTLQIP